MGAVLSVPEQQKLGGPCYPLFMILFEFLLSYYI
jgi:hypothetical protein